MPKEKVYDHVPGGWLLKEARRMLSLDVVVSDICHCDRICNSCAHELAGSGDPDQPMLWLELCWFRNIAEPRAI
jgi:hypothetical protein